MRKKVTIIGAGIGGLSAAVRLQKLGYAVTIYEQAAKPGGKMNQIKSQGFTFDVGPTIVMMKAVYEELFEFCGVDPKDYVPFEPVEPMMQLVFGDQTSMALSRDLPTLIQEIERIAPEDVPGFLGFLGDIYQRYAIAKPNFLEQSFRQWSDFYNRRSLLAGLRLKTFSNAYKNLSQFITNEHLRQALAFQTLYIGISPYQGPSLYNMIPMIELFYGVYFLKGGMYTVVQSLVRLFEELGGTIHLNRPVTKILIRDRQAYGVQLGNQVVLSDYVIGNVDFPTAMTTLLPESQRGKYTDRHLARAKYSCSCFILYLGLDRTYPDQALHTIHLATDFQRNVDELFQTGTLPGDPSYYLYRPRKMDPSLAPMGHDALYVLVPVPELSKFDDWSPETIADYRDLILDKISQQPGFHDLADHIIFERHFTPQDFKTEFGAYNGATFGLRPTLGQSNYYRPQPKFPYAENLYFCGSSIHPGAGVPIVMQSAKLAVKELLKDDHAKSNLI
ncbi:squalene synthase [Lactobacillus plantarum subsp. plantarum ST-III] [Lactiplantibacillus mudanjiangensis]|uniref:phytoene desaturase family protein n=1 Tax=Lactiplantibacillus mudanjiangensis TaxID=1296538 RepID=UPI001014D2D6|nr:phytoene desaturase family protein [Lactiplantibacillus mudanjiangensis]VDG30865.1 squalene synthase [Lactobacillus plantarum subsp. plantarum ST-III] [Lactiplantibacillus mudanjiangensis]